MFRRLADRVNDAVSNAASSLSNNNSNNNINNNNNNNNDDARVSELSAMGFREAEARHALRVVNGDMTRATEWLLSNGSPVGTGTGTAGNPITISETGTTTTTTTTTTTHEDSELQHAIQASLMTENNHQQQRRRQQSQSQSQSAASKNAGRAAVSRTTSTNNNNNNITAKLKQNLSNTHPKVQMPKRLSQHDQEDIIMRCANRVAPYSLTVDTLLRSLRTIQADPSNRKYHAVDTTTAMFRRSLNAPGVLDFLKALNFHPNYNNHKTMTLAHFDAAAFYLGISALEQIQQSSPEYAKDKALRLFQKELASALATNTAEELSARTKFLSKLPSEPTKGSGGSQITVEYGIILNNNNNNNDTDTDTNNTPQSKITRGFDHDDTLGDVVNWLGGQASVIPDKLETGEWRLVDRNRRQDNDNDTGNGNGNGNDDYNYNYQRLDLAELKDRTLQYIGCWPSGRLAIVPKVI